jgi:predicted MFS family arabinose efflux permease
VDDDGDADAEPSLSNLLGTLRAVAADRALLIALVGLTIMLFTFQALTAFLPTYLIQAKGLSQGTASGLFALLFVAGAAFQLAGGDVADRLGTRPVVAGVSVVGIATLAALPFVGGVVALALLVVVLSSRIAVGSVLNPYIIDGIPADSRGATWGLLRTMFFLVGATGSTVVGALADWNLFDEAFYLLAGLTAVAAVLFLLLPRRRDGPADG